MYFSDPAPERKAPPIDVGVAAVGVPRVFPTMSCPDGIAARLGTPVLLVTSAAEFAVASPATVFVAELYSICDTVVAAGDVAVLEAAGTPAPDSWGNCPARPPRGRKTSPRRPGGGRGDGIGRTTDNGGVLRDGVSRKSTCTIAG